MQQYTTAYFGGGCFWKFELLYQRVIGVEKTRVGYMGGKLEYPNYKLVCTGQSGHCEVVEIQYDPKQISFTQLCKIFFEHFDPTQLNKQGLDIGTQYRSAIFCTIQEQLEEARQYIQEIQQNFQDPIVTQVMISEKFWPAEENHQRYLEKGGQSAAKNCKKNIFCYG